MTPPICFLPSMGRPTKGRPISPPPGKKINASGECLVAEKAGNRLFFCHFLFLPSITTNSMFAEFRQSFCLPIYPPASAHHLWHTRSYKALSFISVGFSGRWWFILFFPLGSTDIGGIHTWKGCGFGAHCPKVPGSRVFECLDAPARTCLKPREGKTFKGDFARLTTSYAANLALKVFCVLLCKGTQFIFWGC